MYGVMSRRSGKEKWVLTFSFIMVTMLKVYLMVLKLRIRGSFLKQALQEEGGGWREEGGVSGSLQHQQLGLLKQP